MWLNVQVKLRCVSVCFTTALEDCFFGRKLNINFFYLSSNSTIKNVSCSSFFTSMDSQTFDFSNSFWLPKMWCRVFFFFIVNVCFRKHLRAKSEHRSWRAVREYPLLAWERLLQLCAQGLGSAGQTVWWYAASAGRPSRLHLQFPPHPYLCFCGFRLYRPAHNPQNAVARHRLSGSWEGGSGCGATLHPTLELHQGEETCELEEEAYRRVTVMGFGSRRYVNWDLLFCSC